MFKLASKMLLWFLSVIGGVALAAVAADSWRSWAALLTGFLAGAYILRGGGIPDSGFVGTLAACAAGLHLFRPRLIEVGAACAGFLAATSGAVLESYGIGTPLALIAAVAPVFLSAAWAQRNANFAPPSMREEALLMVMLLGLGTAVVPVVTAGWQSASALRSAPSEAAGNSIPAWVLVVSGSSALLGGVWSLWRHR